METYIRIAPGDNVHAVMYAHYGCAKYYLKQNYGYYHIIEYYELCHVMLIST